MSFKFNAITNRLDLVGTSGGGGGDVSGPGSSTNNAIVRWSGTTGTLIKNSTATLSDAGDIVANSIDLTVPVAVVDGGTGLSTTVIGDILYADASNSLAKLPIGSASQVLTVSGGLPSWQTPSASGVTSVSGTANRITSTGGTTPVIDIAATYVGQTSITTLGTISTGVWQGTAIDATHGGTAQTSWTTGDILYASGANTLSKLTIGSTNQSIIVSSGVPAYADNWGRKVLLSKQTASSSASLIFTSFVNSVYSRYELQLFNIQASNGTTVDFLLQLSQDNGATYITANYDTLINYGRPFNPTFSYGAGGTAWIKLLDNIAISGATSNGLINFYNLGNASLGVDVYGELTLNVYPSSNNQYINRPYGSNYNSTNFNAFKIYMSTGNIASGTAILYGIIDA